jgi:NAD(P)-dependent dehydrogenase (short-subunit alcohol dehydrogenase family)
MSDQRVAVVTGTSTGFGNLTARLLAEAGYRVYGTMRDTAARNAGPKAALEAAGVRIYDLEVTDQASVDAAAAAILADAGGRVDVLINNAGTAHMGITEAFTPESLEQQFATNVAGPQRISRAFLPAMRKAGRGLVIFVSSNVGRTVLPFMGVYGASKFALEALAEALAYELRPTGVEVTIVQPSAYATNIFNATIQPDDPARAAEYTKTLPYLHVLLDRFGNAGDPIEVAQAMVAVANTPQGRRPLRVSVPAGAPSAHVNEAVAPIQNGMLQALGLGDLLAAEVAAV